MPLCPEQPSWLFRSGPTSAPVKQAEDQLSCRVAGAFWVKKLADATDPASAAMKKRAKPADLTEEKAKRQKTPKAKAKSGKGLGKAKAKAGPLALEEGENMDTLQEAMQFQFAVSEAATTRHRLWLDDLIAAVTAVLKNHSVRSERELLPLDAYGSTDHAGLVASAFASGLKFALEGKVKIEKKMLNTWSKARPALQNALKKELEKLDSSEKSALPSAASANDMVQQLASQAKSSSLRDAAEQLQVLTASTTIQTAVSAAKTIMNDKEGISRVEQFVERNNSSTVRQHLSFLSMLKTMKEALCTCPSTDMSVDAGDMPLPKDSRNPSCGFHSDAHTLLDFLGNMNTMGSMVSVPPEAHVVGAASLIIAAGIAHSIRNKKSPVASSPSKKELRLGMVADFLGSFKYPTLNVSDVD